MILLRHFADRIPAADPTARTTKLGVASLAVLAAILSTTAPIYAQSDSDYLIVAQAQSGDWNPRRTQIQQVQGWLKKLGYNPGSTKGAMTEDLRLALRLYQRDNDLSETGRLTRKVFDHLKAKAAAIPDPAPAEQEASDPSNAPSAETANSAAADQPPASQRGTPSESGTDSAASTTEAPTQVPVEQQPSQPETDLLVGDAVGEETPTTSGTAPEIASSLFPEEEVGETTSTDSNLEPDAGSAPSVLALESPPQTPLEPAAPPNSVGAAPEMPTPSDEVMAGRMTTIPEGSVDQPVASLPQTAPQTEPPNTQTAMVAPRPDWCRSAANGAWAIMDENGSEFVITLKEDGTVSGPLYPEYWTWRPTDLGLEITYNNGMGQRVTRHGAVRPGSTIAGEASDSRGRTWSWTAVRMPDSPKSSCETKGPA